ncbi:MAG TPA: DNA topoisomerase I [Nitrososphaerales archaeon]|nr:DNA topoisomerase I [Nitrososphaerales archaeon]
MGYTLVICEKPDAARRVADALSDGNSETMSVEGTTAYGFVRMGEKFVVCSAQGHVYGVSDPSEERTVYPVFDVEWYPTNMLDEDDARAGKRIAAIRRLSAGATKFVNACDFDVEGETIGYNILRYACGGKERAALRAKFSTLTGEDLRKAFDGLEAQPGQGLARAGRARHAIDFVWGINLSRALSQSALGTGHRYRTVSMGRVQGPTLGFLVEREKAIRGFVPIPFWKVTGEFEKGGKRVTAAYSQEKIQTEALATKVHDECVGLQARAASVKKATTQVGPPVPFDIGELQKEAYRAFGFTPSRTLQIAERLYLGALISYPRTGSQRLPLSLDLKGIIARVGKMPEYSEIAGRILRSEPRPVQGAKSDPAHPAVHPTGEKPRRPLDRSESSVFDLVVRRFLAAFGPSARRETVDVTLAVGDHEFRVSGGRTVFPGWIEYYGRYAGYRDRELVSISEGDALGVSGVAVEAKFEQRPSRYNPGSLLEKMEKEGIGTKATRAEVIATLVGRGYASGEAMEVTDLGFAVTEAMEKFAPSIASTALTRDIEQKLEAVEAETEGGAAMLRETVRSVANQLTALNAEEDALGREIGSALASVTAKALVLGRCPVCSVGELRVIRSRATGKRFAGCSNYPSVCRASAPLPQRGTIKTTTRPCGHCSWPVIDVTGRGRPWRLCVNPGCPGKKR